MGVGVWVGWGVELKQGEGRKEGRGGVSNSWLLVSGISKSNCFLVISTGAVHYFSSAGLKCFNFVWKLFLKLRA